MKKLPLKKLNLLSKFLFIFLCNTIYSQNLIVNPSFETISSCPELQGEIEKATTWFSATIGNPDLYNSCSTFGNGSRGVPSNTVGFQEGLSNQSTEVGYIGLYTFSNQDTSFSQNLREYAQTQITSVLTPCSIYEVSFYVSPADFFKYAINSIGAFIGDSAIHRNDYYIFSYYEPQVNNPKTRMLDDKIGWTKIEGKFIANGGEKYITIGNFDLDSEIDTLSTLPGLQGSGYSSSYYYIDNVSLTFFSDANTNIIAGNDTMVAPGDSIFIGQEISNLNCTWRLLDGTFITDSTSGIWVQPTEQTTYVVEQNLCGTITYDTVVVSVGFIGVSSLEGGLRWVTLSPNPNNGSFEIQNPTKQELIFELKNALGQVVYQDQIVSEKQSFDLKLEKGVYFASFSGENGVFEEKVVIR